VASPRIRWPSARGTVIVAVTVAVVGFLSVAHRSRESLLDTTLAGRIVITSDCPNTALLAGLAQLEADRAKLDQLAANPTRREAFDPGVLSSYEADAEAHNAAAASYSAAAAAPPPKWCGLGLPYRWLLSICVLVVAVRLAVRPGATPKS